MCKYFFLCALQCSLSTHGCILVTETSSECTDFHSLFGRPTHIYGTNTVHTHKETVSPPPPAQHTATLKGIVHQKLKFLLLEALVTFSHPQIEIHRGNSRNYNGNKKTEKKNKTYLNTVCVVSSVWKT